MAVASTGSIPDGCTRRHEADDIVHMGHARVLLLVEKGMPCMHTCVNTWD